jgi:integrase/recombinase XerD
MGVTVWKRSDSQFYQAAITWRAPGKDGPDTPHKRSFSTKESNLGRARAFANRELEREKAKRFGDETMLSWSEAKTLFIEHAFPALKPRVQAGYLSIMRQLESHLQSHPMQAMRGAVLGDYITARRREPRPPRADGCKPGKPPKDKTIRNELNVLSAIFEELIRRELVTVNPVQMAIKNFRMKRSEPRTRYLSEDEEAKLIAALDRQIAADRKSGSWMLHGHMMLRAAVIVAIETGVRLNELVNFRPQDIDYTRRRVSVMQQSVAKSKSSMRRVPLRPRAIEALQSLPHSPDIHAPYIFWHGPGEPYLTFIKAFGTAARAAGIAKVDFHDLRRTCGCRLIQRDKLSLQLVSNWLGHADTKVTEKHYAFLGIDWIQNQVDEIDGIMSADNRLQLQVAAPQVVPAQE